MIHFDEVPEPDDFDSRARIPGQTWLKDHPDAKRPHDLWTPFLPQLAEGFGNLCGYSAMFAPRGTVDHYVSCNTDASLAYEWSNYRFAAQWINSSKRTEDTDVLDPYEVADGWFEIVLPSLELRATNRVPKRHRKRAEYTLDRLHLRHDERVMRQRRIWYQHFLDGKLTLQGLRVVAPLIARAVEKEKRTKRRRGAH